VPGFISQTGIAGLKLGGWSYLTPRIGWTVDNLEEPEIITADDEIRVANPPAGTSSRGSPWAGDGRRSARSPAWPRCYSTVSTYPPVECA
jgi:hypothetical protein